MHQLALLGLFTNRNYRLPSLPFHTSTTEARKRYPFWAEPPHIVHYRSTPLSPWGLLFSVSFVCKTLKKKAVPFKILVTKKKIIFPTVESALLLSVAFCERLFFDTTFIDKDIL